MLLFVYKKNYNVLGPDKTSNLPCLNHSDVAYYLALMVTHTTTYHSHTLIHSTCGNPSNNRSFTGLTGQLVCR